ncbi:uncharacterized protein LOC133333358, partial [Musca vetustissima]|uniref:uncharacterized protein LOC133333358 n=1 Tax=Musca vetustissima TaxID=27455 RepID=UPI002AB7F17A
FPTKNNTGFFFAVYTFTTGQRSSIKLVYNGYSFVKFMENSRGTKWICATRSSTKCRARVRTTQDSQLEVLYGEHNHSLKQMKAKHEDKNEIAKLIASIKQNIE